MESFRSSVEQPPVSLSRTIMLLDYLSFCYSKENDIVNKMLGETTSAEDNIQKSLKAYMVQVLGMVDLAAKHLEYLDMDVPAEVESFLKAYGRVEQSSEKFDHTHIKIAKDVIGKSLDALRGTSG